MNDYPDRWEELTLCPQFLANNPKFGMVYLYGKEKEKLIDGWCNVYVHSSSLAIENLSDGSKIQEGLASILLFLVESYRFDLQKEPFYRLEKKGNRIEMQASESCLRKVLLQITKPGPEVCKFTLREEMKFPGYWSASDWEVDREPFSLTFQFSDLGPRIVFPNDYHMMHQYGETVPLYPKSIPWLLALLKTLSIDRFQEVDPCTIQFESLGDFLYLSDLFRERTDLSNGRPLKGL
ncbi:hypothetical protein LPTSP4_16350 [Leptospira ryugenii]|uniref:Uncharacterized protein n=1 Tax=Leptospira ryugenii TaxID=1917863 RepID=A0A2P2DZP1_9LEPT|nr:hypothetical protein [Leptospira ryugenii]GBF50111.1 hypothetical protein LPTSP4_16350 [Leptospira ryugenii]